MATPISCKSLSYVFYVFLLLLLCPFRSLKKSNAIKGTKPTFILSKSILSLHQTSAKNHPKVFCISVLTKGSSSLKLVHKYGPRNQNKASSMGPSFTEILHQDRLRVDSIIQAKRPINSVQSFHSIKKNTVQFYGQSKITASDYIIYVDFGTPKKELPLVMDTSSNIIWTQCNPCKSYYPNTPVFDPSKSTSFKALPCSSTLCQSVGTGTYCYFDKYIVRDTDSRSLLAMLQDAPLLSASTKLDITSFID